jgi:hypothetical protein
MVLSRLYLPHHTSSAAVTSSRCAANSNLPPLALLDVLVVMFHWYSVRILRKQLLYQTLGVQTQKRKRPNEKLVPTFRSETILETFEPKSLGGDFH